MRDFPTPRVVVSRCIEFDAVRWSGQIIRNEHIAKLKNAVEFIPVCPEVEIGLGVPRATLRLVEVDDEVRLMQSETGMDYTAKMKSFASSFLEGLGPVDGFILMGRSPTSGLRGVKIYPRIGKVAAIRKGSGVFAGQVLKRYGHLAVEEEGRLNNSRIREHFLRKLYTLADFRGISGTDDVSDLARFHRNNMLMLKSYNKSELRALTRIVANKDNRPLEVVLRDYEEHLHGALKRAPRCDSTINVLESSMGHFSGRISGDEKDFFMDFVNRYREAQVPLIVPFDILRSWIVRFDDDYLRAQTFFEPYPEELMDIDSIIEACDSRDYWKDVE